MTRQTHLPTLFALGLSALAIGCDGSPASSSSGSVGRPVPYVHQAVDTPAAPNVNLPDYQYSPPGSGLHQSASQVGALDRSIDYSLALRTASIKLRGDLPTMTEIRRLQNAVAAGGNAGDESDPAFVYSDLVRSYIYDMPASFNRQMVQFWRNTLRMGGNPLSGLFGRTSKDMRTVSLETAPAFAARLVADDKDMRMLFTQDSNACPTFNPATGAFTDGACFISGGSALKSPGSNVPEGQQAGVLTNPGFQAQYYSNFGFRRARLIQELFVCTRMPAEFAAAPVQMGPYLYSSPWPVDSVSSAVKPPTLDSPRVIFDGNTTTSKDFVDFNVSCQNCHSTLNHRAPLFVNFDAAGFLQATISVHSPTTDSPFAQLQEYLPVGAQGLAWRFGVSATDFKSFGQAMAADPATAKCMMIRAWNNAYSRNDVVNELDLVPDSVIKDLTDYFVNNNYNMKKALLHLYTDANFIRF